MRATTCWTPKVSRATRAAMMLELSPLLTAAKAPAESTPASSSVCRSKPSPVTWRPVNSGPSRRKASGSWSMTATLCPTSSSRLAMAEPTRPQPITTTCTKDSPQVSSRRRRPPRVPARSYTRRRPPRRRDRRHPPPGRGAPTARGAAVAATSVRSPPCPACPTSDNSRSVSSSAAPVRSDRAGESLLSKRLALPIFASDALSSVAYATQEILIVLTLAGTAYLYLAPWMATAVVVLMITVVLSYRQVVRAYPSGGGDYEVAMKNHGRLAGARGGQRAAGRLRADRRGVGLRRHGQHHLGVPVAEPAPRAIALGLVVLLAAVEPARGPRVGHGVRRAPRTCSSPASSS